MDQTFALRRKEIVEDQPPIDLMLGRWPALFTKKQVSKYEFTLITNGKEMYSLKVYFFLLRFLQNSHVWQVKTWKKTSSTLWMDFQHAY